MKNCIVLMLSIPILLWFTGCEKPVSVLLVVGGHSYDTTEFLDMFREMKGIRVDTVSHPEAIHQLRSGALENYDVVAYYDYIPDLPQKDSSVYLELLQQGKPMLFLHHAICTFQGWDGYKRMVGGRYVMPEYCTDSTLLSDYRHDLNLDVKVLQPGHPVARGVTDFQIHDEGYSNLWVMEGVLPLLGTNHPDCSPLVGWINPMEKSTSVYLIFGHDRQAYRNVSFRQLVYNSLTWLDEQNR